MLLAGVLILSIIVSVKWYHHTFTSKIVFIYVFMMTNEMVHLVMVIFSIHISTLEKFLVTSFVQSLKILFHTYLLFEGGINIHKTASIQYVQFNEFGHM